MDRGRHGRPEVGIDRRLAVGRFIFLAGELEEETVVEGLGLVQTQLGADLLDHLLHQQVLVERDLLERVVQELDLDLCGERGE